MTSKKLTAKQIIRKARRDSGLARYERENPRWRMPGTREAGEQNMRHEIAKDIFAKLANADLEATS